MSARLALLAAALLAVPAGAQTPPAPAAQSQPDAASLQLGRSIAAALLPAGTYRRVMNGSVSQLMDGMTHQMMSMPLRQFAGMAGLAPADLQKLSDTSMQQIMAIVDPAFEQRMHIMMPLLMDQMVTIMGQYEPDIREGMAEAYARRFTPAQLADLDRFFHTPTGALYASQAMIIQTDPLVMHRMQAFAPALMQAMPGIMEKVQAQTAGLPKPKTAADLTDADRAKLAQLLGVDPARLKPSTSKEPAS